MSGVLFRDLRVVSSRDLLENRGYFGPNMRRFNRTLATLG